MVKSTDTADENERAAVKKILYTVVLGSWFALPSLGRAFLFVVMTLSIPTIAFVPVIKGLADGRGWLPFWLSAPLITFSFVWYIYVSCEGYAAVERLTEG